MDNDLQLNVSLLKRRVPNLTVAAKSVGLRPATVSNLCTGKIPVGRAEVRTLVALATIAGCTLDELIIHGSGTEMIETGIKVIDLFAPLVRGGTIGLVARPSMGQLVLMAELFYRMKSLDFTTFFLMPSEDILGVEDVKKHSDFSSSNLKEIYNKVKEVGNDKEIVLGLDRTMVVSGDLFDLREQLQKATSGPITFILVDTLGEAVDEDSPYGPLETLWQFDMDLVTRKMYPAIDPVLSTSTVLEGAHLESTHLIIQQRAKKLLRRYRELRFIVNTWGTDRLTEADELIYRRGIRLEAFLTQPFYIAEPFTNKKGEWVSAPDTIEQVRRLLDGVADETDPDLLMYIGGALNE
ncbi:ATP synthase beta subunit C-terminal domain-containing protein [Caldalkalibacillus mannanilyticus]|uniref:ATP synthase beta subunit C-terminal domain-containing protein n=1 Tax=Caldalkalibacillus mannanilyticus TaxID=1418 RepID=UPI000468D41A|nr:ATP synthase subunit B [Caldalkalibacillus mannanilyticus]